MKKAKLRVSPGKHEFRSDSKDYPLLLDLEPGSTHYLREGYELATPSFSLNGVRILIDTNVGTADAQLKKTKPAPASEILDWSSVVDPKRE